MATNVQLFQPTQISGCAVWLDAYRVNGTTTPANNTTVASWVNLVSGGTNFTQATPSRQPTFVANSINGSRPSLFFNSSNTAASIQFLFAGPNVQTTRDVSYFYVAQYINVGGGDQTQIDQRKDINAIPLRTLKASQNQARDPAGNIYSLSFTSIPLVPTIRSYRDTLNTINGSYNGTLVSNSSATYNQQAADNYGILIGCHFDAMNNNTIASLTFSKYYMAEVLMYNRYVSFNEQQQIEGYLAWKWGIQASLPTTHPFYNYPPYALPPFPTPPSIPRVLTNIQTFLPNQIPGCVIWFDGADRGTLGFTGSAVSTWTSKGSASMTATSVGGGSILYSNFNGFPGLYFNGTNTRMTTGSISSYGASGTTWLTASVNLTPVVPNSTPVDASVVFATLSGSSPEKSIRYNFPPQFVTYTFNNGQIRGGRTNNDNGVRGLIDSGPSMYAFVNGTDITESQLSATYQPGVNQSFQLGQWNTGWLLGYIQEVVVYNFPLSIPQYRLVEGYLAWKWGYQSTLPATHPYRNYPPYALPPFPTPPRIPRVITRS